MLASLLANVSIAELPQPVPEESEFGGGGVVRRKGRGAPLDVRYGDPEKRIKRYEDFDFYDEDEEICLLLMTVH